MTVFVDGITIAQQGIRAIDPFPVTDGVAKGRGRNSANSITAGTTQTQAGATQMYHGNNDISVCANASDGVALPTADAGSVLFFFNSGAQTCKVYGKNGDTDTINGTAGATGVTGPAAGKMGFAMCAERGKWKMGITG